jgi:hypothetical protein
MSRGPIAVLLCILAFLGACGAPAGPPTPTARPRAEQIAQLTQVAVAQEASAVARAATQNAKLQTTATATLTPTPTAPAPTPTRPAVQSPTVATTRRAATVAPTAIRPPAPSPVGLPLIDDFTDQSTGWPVNQVFSSANGPGLNVMRYRDDGAYLLLFGIPLTRMSAANDLIGAVRDTIIEVDATMELGGVDRATGYGVQCRWQMTTGQGYMFRLLGYGGWGVYRSEAGGEYRLGGSAGVPEPAIHPGSVTNQIRAECVGDRLRLSVNGVLLLDVIDPDPLLAPGAITLAANRSAETYLTVRFTNFVAVVP